MPSPNRGQDVGKPPSGYNTPTSLNFINRPNPVEPHAEPQKHPLHRGAHIGQDQGLRRLLLDPTSAPVINSREDVVKRRKTDDGTSLDLPRLPVRSGNAGTRRTRLPPTLSGLHQPPPNAGILPSIFDQPQQSSSAIQPAKTDALPFVSKENAQVVPDERPSVPHAKPPKPPRRNKWSDEETADLLKGVARFGIGSWTKILKCTEYHFERRTALDLKDRFRVCCPDQYKNKPPVANQKPDGAKAKSKNGSKERSDRLDDKALADMGIDQPLQRNTRRQRHPYNSDEDDALLRGFRKYGKSWASIRQDADLQLGHRTATDLRDRLRQKYPEEYSKAGLAPRPETFPRPAAREPEPKASELGEVERTDPVTSAASASTVAPRTEEPRMPNHSKSSASSKAAQPLLFNADDVFFGLPFNDEDFDSEPVVLDRGILDWALDPARPSASEATKMNIERSSTLRLSGPQTQYNQSNNASLPSLATITAPGQEEDPDQFELPSLMQYFGSLDAENRASGQGFSSLDELLG